MSSSSAGSDASPVQAVKAQTGPAFGFLAAWIALASLGAAADSAPPEARPVLRCVPDAAEAAARRLQDWSAWLDRSWGAKR